MYTKTIGTCAVYFHLNSTKMFRDCDASLHQHKPSDCPISHSFSHASFTTIKTANQPN